MVDIVVITINIVESTKHTPMRMTTIMTTMTIMIKKIKKRNYLHVLSVLLGLQSNYWCYTCVLLS